MLSFRAHYNITELYFFCHADRSGFNFTTADLGDVDAYQRIVETFKFGYALRTYLGDETFTNVSQVCRLIVN